MDFPTWAEKQPHGALTQVARETGCAYVTLHRLKRGARIDSYDLARRISDATGGEVSIAELCEERRGEVA